MKLDKMLTFEEFISRDKINFPIYNNLPSYWMKGMIGDIYRQSEQYKKFREEAPELDKKLFKRISQFKSISRGLKNTNIEKDLYEAYKVMRKFAKEDEEIFR